MSENNSKWESDKSSTAEDARDQHSISEAVALSGISTVEVAEALCSVCSRVGVPRQVVHDQGSQFMSDVMAEVSRLLSVQNLVSSPYHPQCNCLDERFNGTLKAMLRKLCAERPKD